MATHLVAFASLASQVLALFLDRKVSAPPADGAGQAGGLTGLQQNHGDQKQGQQNHDNGQNKHRNTHKANHSFL